MEHRTPPDGDDAKLSFRDRLAQIPDVDSPNDPEPLDQERGDWDRAAPPIVRRPAPVARPAQPETPGERIDRSYDQHVTTQPPADQHFAPQRDAQSHEPAHHSERQVIGKRQRRWPFVVGLAVVVIALVVLVPLFVARRTFDSIPRIPVAESLSTPATAGRNILLVGTDSRDGIDTSTENAEVILGEGIAGERSDTIMVLRISEDGSRFLSLPRDLWLPINGGDEQRINTAIRQGPDALINTVQGAPLGIPISSYVQVDLAGFIDLVDAVGGVDIVIEHPAFDRGSGLDLPTAGTVTLDSAQALAWVRSRTYTEIVDGQPVVDPTADLGRVARQQVFMRALLTKVLDQRNPVVLNEMAESIAAAIAIDDSTSMTDVLAFANDLRSGTPESVVLPTVPDRRSGNSVLVLTDAAPEILRSFGAQ